MKNNSKKEFLTNVIVNFLTTVSIITIVFIAFASVGLAFALISAFTSSL